MDDFFQRARWTIVAIAVLMMAAIVITIARSI